MAADSLKEQKKELSESADVLRSVADDLAEAEEDFSAAILDANRSFEHISEFGIPVSEDDIRQKQRSFSRRKRHYLSGPPVWYQRMQGVRRKVGSRASLKSSAARSRH